MDDRHKLIRKYGLYNLPANGSSVEYMDELNSWLKAEYPLIKPLTQKFIARVLRDMGFLCVGRNRMGQNLLHNPFHGKGPVI